MMKEEEKKLYLLLLSSTPPLPPAVSLQGGFVCFVLFFISSLVSTSIQLIAARMSLLELICCVMYRPRSFGQSQDVS